MVLLEQQGNLEQQDNLVLLDPKELQDQLDRQEIQDHQGNQVLGEIQVYKVLLVQQDRLALKDLQAVEVIQV